MPLAHIIRPTLLNDFIGQEHLLSSDSILRMMIEKNCLKSMIFWGPSGTGKTTLAEIISKNLNIKFIKLNATNSNTKNLRECIESAKANLDINKTKTVVFIDEIHRHSKNIQDILLPYIEDGTIILIGATTENPFFAINGSILSRLVIFEFYQLEPKHIAKSIIKCIDYYKNKGINIKINKDAIIYLSKMSNGDVRRAITSIEFMIDALEDKHITIDFCKQVMPKKYSVVSRDTAIYDSLSAIQGAIQASDVDGAIFWLGQAINHGEDLATICRRLLVSASEDVGCCNPMAAVHTYSCVKSALIVGLPEAKIILSSCVAYLAMNPRSKAAISSVNKSMKLDLSSDVRIPDYLRDCHYKGAKIMNHGSYNDGENMKVYKKFPIKLFTPENGDEVGLMDYNSKLWK